MSHLLRSTHRSLSLSILTSYDALNSKYCKKALHWPRSGAALIYESKYKYLEGSLIIWAIQHQQQAAPQDPLSVIHGLLTRFTVLAWIPSCRTGFKWSPKVIGYYLSLLFIALISTITKEVGEEKDLFNLYTQIKSITEGSQGKNLSR